MARDDGRLKGFSFSTLERIGGTPAVLIGLAEVGRNSKRDTILRALVHDPPVLIFDEATAGLDVLVYERCPS